MGGGKTYERLAVSYPHISTIPIPIHATASLRQEHQRIHAAAGTIHAQAADGYGRLLYSTANAA